MRSKKMIIWVVVIFAVVAMTVTLAINKQKINAANKIVDRSQIPVTVTSFVVSEGKLALKTTLPAKLKPFEEASVNVQTPGIIGYLNIELGSRVSKGEIIGAVDTKIARLNLKSTQFTREKFKDDYKRAVELYEGNATSEINLITAKYNYDNTSVQAELIKQQIDNANIIAPISGTVTSRNLKAGEFTNAGTPIAFIVNISKLKATVFVNETEVYLIHKNESADIVSPVFPDKKIKGNVIYVSPNGDENHNYQVDVSVNNNPEIFKAGTDVSVTFNLTTKQNVIMIPKIALVADRKEPYVYVINNGIASGREIAVGLSQGDNIEVVSGLSAGETTVLSGQINLSEGSIVSIVKQ